ATRARPSPARFAAAAGEPPRSRRGRRARPLRRVPRPPWPPGCAPAPRPAPARAGRGSRRDAAPRWHADGGVAGPARTAAPVGAFEPPPRLPPTPATTPRRAAPATGPVSWLGGGRP